MKLFVYKLIWKTFLFTFTQKSLSEFLVKKRVKGSEQRAKSNKQRAKSNKQQAKKSKAYQSLINELEKLCYFLQHVRSHISFH